MTTAKSTHLGLRELQRQVAGAIQAPDTLTAGADLASNVGLVFDSRDPAATVTRFKVHSDGYLARIREALLESFPAVCHVVGDRAFTDLTCRFLPTLPRGTYNLSEVGRLLPRFLETDLLAGELPFLSDLADLEWAVVEAFHASLEQPFDAGGCLQWSLDDWRNVVVRFQPSLFLLRSGWPVREIREARETVISEVDIDLRDRPDRVLVYRRGFSVVCESIGAREALVMERLLAGETLGSVLEAAYRAEGDARGIPDWISRWTGLGLIVCCSPNAGADSSESQPPSSASV